MPKRLSSQDKGGRISGGAPSKSVAPHRNAGWAVSPELKATIAGLPQVTSGEWSQSYLVEQALRCWLGMDGDYSAADLEMVARKQILD